jgi:hypothetical protein
MAKLYVIAVAKCMEVDLPTDIEVVVNDTTYIYEVNKFSFDGVKKHIQRADFVPSVLET